MKCIEDQDSSDIAFDEVREMPSTPPEVGIFPDGPSVHPSSDNLNLSAEEEASKMDAIPSAKMVKTYSRQRILLILEIKTLTLTLMTI